MRNNCYNNIFFKKTDGRFLSGNYGGQKEWNNIDKVLKELSMQQKMILQEGYRHFQMKENVKNSDLL